MNVIVLAVVAVWLAVAYKVARIIIKHEAAAIDASPTVRRAHIYLLAALWPLAMVVLFANILNDALDECWKDDE